MTNGMCGPESNVDAKRSVLPRLLPTDKRVGNNAYSVQQGRQNVNPG